MDWGSNVLSLLAGVSVRALILAAAAWVALRAGSPRTAAARHAVWAMVACGMLLCLAAPLVPPVYVRVLRAAPVAQAAPAVVVETAAAPSPLPVERAYRPSWRQVVAAVYGLGALVFLLRMIFAYGFTWRLVRGSHLVERSAAGDVYESASIAVPMTTGWVRPKILLPRDWREWEPAKLDAVFAHERRRVDALAEPG